MDSRRQEIASCKLILRRNGWEAEDFPDDQNSSPGTGGGGAGILGRRRDRDVPLLDSSPRIWDVVVHLEHSI